MLKNWFNRKEVDPEQLLQMIRLGNTNEFNQLISKVDINIRNTFGQNMLSEAAAYNQQAMGKMLIDRGIDLNNQDNKGQTALHYSAVHNNLDLARMILEKGGDVNIRDTYGNNALWTAVFNAKGKYDMVRLFIQYGGDPNIKNNSGRSPLDFAKQINDGELVELLKSL